MGKIMDDVLAIRTLAVNGDNASQLNSVSSM
jgi:hypothetical protein